MNTAKKDIIDELIQLRKECNYFKDRWELITGIQEIINRGKNTLKIPVTYPYELPAYLGLLSDPNQVIIEILGTNSASIDNEIKIKNDLAKFGLEGRIAKNAATSANREDELQSLLEVLPANQQQFIPTDIEPGTESSTDSMIVHPGTDHDLDEEEDSEQENKPPTFQPVVQHLSAFDAKVSVCGSCDTAWLASTGTALTINPAFCGIDK